MKEYIYKSAGRYFIQIYYTYPKRDGDKVVHKVPRALNYATCLLKKSGDFLSNNDIMCTKSIPAC